MTSTTLQLHTYRTVAFDFDGTLASAGRLAPDVVAALAALKENRRRLVLVTGRTWKDLGQVCAELDLFDAIVAENGAVLRTGADGHPRNLAVPPPTGFIEALSRNGVEFGAGRVILGISSACAHSAKAVLEELGLSWQVIFNKDAAMLVPPGIDKGTGLTQALNDLATAPTDCIAVGDAQNDEPMLRTAGLGIATGNAVDSLKAQADLVLSKDNGRGIVELVHEHILKLGP